MKAERFERSHYRLLAWQKAVKLATQIYSFTSKFPQEEVYGLVSQIRRSSVSVASNIAEGAGRNSGSDKIRFFTIARGSLMELDTQIEIANELGYCGEESLENIRLLLDDVSRLLSGLISSRKIRNVEINS